MKIFGFLISTALVYILVLSCVSPFEPKDSPSFNNNYHPVNVDVSNTNWKVGWAIISSKKKDFIHNLMITNERVEFDSSVYIFWDCTFGIYKMAIENHDTLILRGDNGIAYRAKYSISGSALTTKYGIDTFIFSIKSDSVMTLNLASCNEMIYYDNGDSSSGAASFGDVASRDWYITNQFAKDSTDFRKIDSIRCETIEYYFLKQY